MDRGTDAATSGRALRVRLLARRLPRIAGGFLRRFAPLLLAIAVYVAFVRLNRVAVERATLEVMGFDPDRADLLIALTLTAMCAGVAALPRPTRLVSTLVGFVAGVVSFAPVVIRETQVALGPVPPNGPFDPFGWIESIAALVSAGLATAWAVSVLLGELIAALVEVARYVSVRRPGKRDLPHGNPLPPAATLVVALVFLATSPTLLDLLTGMPDVHMSTGGAPGVYTDQGPAADPLAAIGEERSGQSPTPIPTSTTAPTATPDPTSTVSPVDSINPTASPTLIRTPSPTSKSVSSSLRFEPGPWLAWRPKGAGRIVELTAPAPWTGGFETSAHTSVYLPAGYDAGTRRYPVFYQTPWGYGVWKDNYHIAAVLDDLISSGRIPASIFVFATDYGGPYGPSECADSADGQERFDTYIATTLLGQIDGEFRTIATRAGRVLWGFSDGAHCAATLGLHHQELFGQAILISGIYNTDSDHLVPPERLPFGDDKALMLGYSPLALVSNADARHRHDLHLIVAGDPADRAFGPDMTAFVDAAKRTGFPYVALRVNVIHGWDQIRRVLPTTFQEAASWMTSIGVFAAG